MLPYFTPYFKFFFDGFWGFPEQKKGFANTTDGGGGTHL